MAAVVEREGSFLVVEERASRGVVLNQPAGHLEEGESLLDAVVRETREETAWDFDPDALVGIYLWKNPASGRTILRVAFSGSCHSHDADRALDVGILRTAWLSRDQLVAQQRRLRSPMVLRCIDDYLKGQRYPTDIVSQVAVADLAAAVS